MNNLLILSLLILIIGIQSNPFKYYDIDLVSMNPLTYNFQGTEYHSCTPQSYIDTNIICRQEGYQIVNFYREPTIISTQCNNYESLGVQLNCYATQYSGLHIEECNNIYTNYCYQDCVQLICQNYRCATQKSNSHDCDTCIGTNRIATTCVCPQDMVDMFPEYEDCQASAPASDGDLKIEQVNGVDLLKIYHANQFKPICGGFNFDEVAATIACNQLGSNSYLSYGTTDCPVGEYSENFTNEQWEAFVLDYSTWFNFYECEGSENKLEDCQRTQYLYYECYNECITLTCQTLPETDGDLRMDGGQANKSSIVEIQHKNQDTGLQEWRPICDYSINNELAHVMCVQQGFKTFKTYFAGQECPLNNENGDSTLFWFGRLICKGNETQVTKCRYPDQWEQDEFPCKCILLQCTNDHELASEGSVRISNNAIEIYHDQEWGQVCTNKSLENIGKVVCNQLRKTIKNTIAQKIGLLQTTTSEKQQYVCPNYTNFSISDIDCPTGNEPDLLSCNINSQWSKHNCEKVDCIYLACDGDVDIQSLQNFQEGDLKLNDDGIVQIYHNNLWKPISDSGDEYKPQDGYYGQSINKASAHVICKQMGFATYKNFEVKQECGTGFNGYWLGNIMCKGNEVRLVECYHLPWGETLSGTNSNDCVKIECSADQTCVGNNRIIQNKYPYCACQDGYYDDGLQSDCLKCSDLCRTCIFSAENCLECSEEQANYKVLNYEKYYEQQGITFDDEEDDFRRQRILQFDDEYSFEEQGMYNNCEQYNCCSYSEYCGFCDQYYCMMCFNGGNPLNGCSGGFSTNNDNQDEQYNECQIISPYCLTCDIQNMECSTCQTNFDIDTNCIYAYPAHHENAPCVHISENCIKCKGDFCYECQPGYLSQFNCQIQQKSDCKQINDNCLVCNTFTSQCTECLPNYDPFTNCEDLLPIGHYMAPCVKFSKYCLECNESKCTLCSGRWDSKYNCQTIIPIEEQCSQSGCENCNGYTCLDEVFVDDDAPKPIIEFETQVTIGLLDLTFEQHIQTLTINPNGKLVAPTEEFIDSWGIYTCSLYCAEGYFRHEDGQCKKCSGKCRVCVDNKDNCLICRYANNPYVGQAPNCDCLEGSKIVGNNCEECDPGFYNFEINVERCTRCPENANCLGGNLIRLNEGYWRDNEKSANIEWCQNNEDACKGGTKTQVTEQCIEGHKGALCEVCDLDGSVWGERYSNSADFECALCSKVDKNALKIIGINILQFICMFLSVNGTITAVQDKIKFNSLKSLFNTHEPTPDESGVLMKILNNYLFILGVLTTFQLSLPSGIKAFNSGVSNPTKQMSHSFDCLLDSFNTAMPVLYFKVFWQIFIGIFQLLLVFLLIGAGKKAKKIVTPIKSAIFTTIIYQFISMQPGVITMILETIACREIAGENYILSNTSKKCEGTEYYAYTFSLMLPLFFIFGGVIPYILYKGLKQCYETDLNLQQPIKNENSKQDNNNKDNKETQQQQIENKEDLENQTQQDQQKQDQTQQQQQSQNQNQKLTFKEKALNYYKKQKESYVQKRKEKQQQQIKKQEEEKQEQFDDNHKQLDRQKEIQKRTTKENYLDRALPLGKYGYLYLEYKTQVYWWEFVKIYQRLLIAMTLAFYYNDVKVKGILIFLIVFFYTVLSIKYKPYRLESHNRIDVISGTVTGVSLILGIFIYQNDYPEWVVIAAILVFALNIYFIVLMITKIVYGKAKTFVSKTNIKIEQQEQIALFDDQMKERKKIIGDLKEKENQKNLLVKEDNFKNDDKIADLEKEITILNKKIISIEELLFSLEYLPKNKIEELQKEIENLPSFILHRGFEENIIKERELKIRHSKQYSQRRFSELDDDFVENNNISKISEEENDEPDSPQKNKKSSQSAKPKQNKIVSTKLAIQKNDQEIPESEDSEQSDSEPTKQPNEQPQKPKQTSISQSKKPAVNEEQTPMENEESEMINSDQININMAKYTKNKSRNSIEDRRRSSIMTKKIQNLDTQFSSSIQAETDNYAQLSKKSKIKSRQLQLTSLQNKDEYNKFQQNREKQKQLKKPNPVFEKIQKAGELVLSLFIGKTDSEDMKKAKFLRQMIKFYFKNLIVDGYNAGFVKLASIDEEKQQQIQKITHVKDSQYLIKFPINRLLKGNLTSDEQQVLYINIQEDKQFQEWLKKQILHQVSINYAKRLQELNYDKKIWEEKIKESQKNQDQPLNNSSLQQYNLKKFQKIIDQKVELYTKKLTEQDIQQEYTAFKLFDINGKRIVTGENINDIMLKLNQNISKKELDTMINQVDSNENGEVDFCEFLALISSKEESESEKYVIKEIFNYYCSQSNGKLDYLDIDKILRNTYKIFECKAVLKEVIRGIDQHAPETLDIISFLRLIY